jgi:uncharacterized membrane protein
LSAKNSKDKNIGDVMKSTRVFLHAILVLILIINNFSCAYYNVIDLGGNNSHAYSVNDNGQIVGAANDRACLFDSTGGKANIDLGTFSDPTSMALSINNSAQVVGTKTNATGSGTFYLACVFNSTGGVTNMGLGTFGGPNSSAYSINNNGQIVGSATSNKQIPPTLWYEEHACLFDKTGGGANIDLGILSGYSFSYAHSINNNGQIAGFSYNPTNMGYAQNPHGHACLFDPTGGGANTDLGALGTYIDSAASSINDNDQIAGRAYYTVRNSAGTYDTYSRACLFDSTGGGANINLGTLNSYQNSSASSINNNGQIVGSVFNASNSSHACLFDSTGGGNNIDLNSLINPSSGWILMSASDINNNGWIVGYGTLYGQTHAFLLVVPEPATIILFTLGGLAVMRRKK